MAIIGLNCSRGYRTFEECIACPRQCIVEQAVRLQLSKMHGGPADTDGGYYVFDKDVYHVTELLGCPRRLVLARHAGDFITPKGLWRITVGVLGHGMMEQCPIAPGKVEQAVHGDYEINGRKCRVVGRYDFFDESTQFLNDYKFIWDTRFIPNEKHFQQMACYETLSRNMGEGVAKGFQIVYVIVTECGRRDVFIADGDKFDELVKAMPEHINDMLGCYTRSYTDGVLPAGDVKAGECNYCPKEFKMNCDARAGKQITQDYYSADYILKLIYDYRNANMFDDEI